MSRTAYFKGLKLGDLVTKKERFAYPFTKLILQASAQGARSRAASVGASGYYRVGFEVGFRIGGAEASQDFWARVRAWVVACAATLDYGSGTSQEGSLCFVRDHDGSAGNDVDSTTNTNGTITGGGADQIVTAVATNWNVGEFILVIDVVDRNIYEVIVIDTAGSSTDYQITPVLSYAANAELHRIEWTLPLCSLQVDPDADRGETPDKWVRGIQMEFHGVTDPVEGGL